MRVRVTSTEAICAFGKRGKVIELTRRQNLLFYFFIIKKSMTKLIVLEEYGLTCTEYNESAVD